MSRDNNRKEPHECDSNYTSEATKALETERSAKERGGPEGRVRDKLEAFFQEVNPSKLEIPSFLGFVLNSIMGTR